MLCVVSDKTGCCKEALPGSTMTSFGWKRKIGEKVSQDKSEAFKKEASSDVDPEVASGDIDWLTPKRRVIQLEDVNIKWNRLVQEGSTLAENDR